jgi:hypothetical protein
MAPLSLKELRNVLMPGLHRVTGSYRDVPVWDDIFAEQPASTEHSDYLNGLAAAEDFINENKKNT